jgi:glycosyltransferase involved in cell wall biosynthesis
MLWRHKNKVVNSFDISANSYRKAFVLSCKELDINFEGGFFYIPDKDISQREKIEKEYAECLATTKRISFKKYLEKTKKSMFVFNTPSVWGCHGWKLAEYLCMGKAIISTPLNNVMPDSFQHGIHYHLVENEKEISNAIEILLKDKEYRQSLEYNARKYFEEYLSPKSVIKRIVNQVSIIT